MAGDSRATGRPRSVIVGTAGHIDHGKSALVQALTGTDPDRLKEEKARGITIDLGFAHAVFDGVNFAFVDVPGHERFVKNMLAGVGGIDAVVLVVAADESVMPQTREHFEICRLLRVRSGLVVLSKADLVDRDTIELVRLEVAELVAGSFLQGAPVIPVSARNGSGLAELRAALAGLGRRIPERTVRSVARLPVDRVFSMKGFGTVVTGTLTSGRIAADSDVVLLPGGRPVKVRGVQVHGQPRAAAHAGERAAINVAGVEVADIARGQNLATAGAFAETRVVDASIEVLQGARPLNHGMRVRFHQGTAEAIGRVSLVGPDAAAIRPGARGFVRLRLETPVVVARGDRYILRAYSPPSTIAGGLILDPVPPRSRIRAASALRRLQALDLEPESDPQRSAVASAAALVADAGPAALPVAALVSRLGVDPERLEATVGALLAGGGTSRADDVLVASAILSGLERAVLEALARYHASAPLSDGIAREELRAQLFRRGHPSVFARALENLAAEGRIALRERVALAAHRVVLSPEEERARQAIETAFVKGGLTPPDVAALAAQTGIAAPVIDRVIRILQRQKVLVRVDALLFHDGALQQLKADVASLKAAGGPAKIDVAAFKTRFGVTRKFAIPLLEYLDRERVTRRAGDARIVL